MLPGTTALLQPYYSHLKRHEEVQMTVIVAGYFEFANPEEVPEILLSARPHIEGALTEGGKQPRAGEWSEPKAQAHVAQR